MQNTCIFWTDNIEMIDFCFDANAIKFSKENRLKIFNKLPVKTLLAWHFNFF